MILQVHDELDFECPVDEVERLTAMVRDVMEHVVDLRVPLIAEASTGITCRCQIKKYPQPQSNQNQKGAPCQQGAPSSKYIQLSI